MMVLRYFFASSLDVDTIYIESDKASNYFQPDMTKTLIMWNCGRRGVLGKINTPVRK